MIKILINSFLFFSENESHFFKPHRIMRISLILVIVIQLRQIKDNQISKDKYKPNL